MQPTIISRLQDWIINAEKQVKPWVFFWGLGTAAFALTVVLLVAATPLLQIFAPFSYLVGLVFILTLTSIALWIFFSMTQHVFGWPRRASTPALVGTASTSGASTLAAQAPTAAPPADINTWRRVEVLSLSQAANLWIGQEPPPIGQPRVAAAANGTYQMLLAAARTGKLKVVSHIGLGVNTNVSRQELQRYAAREGDSPAFLEDAKNPGIVPNQP